MAARLLGDGEAGLGLDAGSLCLGARGYVFVEGYWDYSVGRRGILFAPVYFNASVYGRRGFFYSPTTVIDAGVFSDQLFLRPSYGHYYFGDYYAAGYANAGFYPSFSYQSRRYGYDPIYAHQTWEHRREPDWGRQIQANFQDRRDHQEARPPRTLAAQNALVAGAGNPKNRGFVAATSLGQLAKRQDSPLRLQPVAKDERRQFAQHGQDIQKFGQDRKALEATVARSPADPLSKGSEPSRVKLSVSPLASKPVDQLGNKNVPPRAHEVLKPDLTVEPKPRADAPPRANLEPQPKTSVEPQPQPRVEPQPRPAIEAQPKPRGEAQPRPNSEPQPKPRIEPQTRPIPDSQPKPKAEPQPHPAAAPQAEAQGRSTTTPGPGASAQADTRSERKNQNVKMIQFFSTKGGGMKTALLNASIATAIVMCATGLLVAKEPRGGSGNSAGGSNGVQGKGPDHGQNDSRGQSDARSNFDTIGKEKSSSNQEKTNSRGNGKADGERQRTEGGGRDNWRYRQTGNRWWYWTADKRWVYWDNNRWVGTSSENSQDENAWRYRRYEGRWWYWTTENRWLYWNDSEWFASSG